MSQYISKFSYGLAWQDVDNNPLKLPTATIESGYDVPINGIIPVPVGTPSGTEIDVSLTGIVSACAMLVIRNCTGQELNAAWQGNWAPHLPPMGMFAYCLPTTPAGGRITGWRFFLTETQSVLNGGIKYWAFGA